MKKKARAVNGARQCLKMNEACFGSAHQVCPRHNIWQTQEFGLSL